MPPVDGSYLPAASNGREIIGPIKGNSFDITDLSPDERRYSMEATQYPDAAFDGKVTLTLKLFNSAGIEMHSEDAIVRVSPWISNSSAKFEYTLLGLRVSER